MAKSVAITGAAGKLGRVVVKAFQRSGWRVTAIVRHGEEAAAGKALSPKTKVVSAELTDSSKTNIDFLAKAVSGCGVVVHLAGLVDYHAARKTLFDANVLTTANVLLAAKKAGAKRFVYTSSTSLYRRPRYLPVDERHPVETINDYGESKAAAEELVRNAGIPYVILRPCAMYGPSFASQYESLLKRIEGGRMRIIGKGGNHVAFLFEDDAAEAFVKAAESKVVNEDFIVAPDEKITQKQAFEIVAQALGVEPPNKTVPKRLAWLAALVEINKSRLLGRKPKVTMEELDSIAGDRYYSPAKAREKLGWKAKTPFRVGMKGMLAARKK